MARPTTYLPAAASFTVKINGRDLYDYGMLTYQAPFMGRGAVNLFNITLPGRHLGYVFSGQQAPTPFVITGLMLQSSVAALHTALDEIKEDTASLIGKNFLDPAPCRIEFANLTDRHWEVYYVGPFDAKSIIETDPTGRRQAFVTLPFAAINPFAIANSPTHVTIATATGPKFQVLDTGSAPCPPLIEIEGAATAIDFALTNMAFYADLDYDLDATDIDGSTITGTTGSAAKPDQFTPGDYGGGLFLQDNTGWDTTWASIVQNPDEQTWIFYIKPQFAYDVASDQVVFSFYAAADDYIELLYDASEDKWTARKNNDGGGDIEVAGSAQTSFASNDATVLAVSFGPDKMKIYEIGELITTHATETAGITGTSGTVELGEHGDADDGVCGYDYIFGFPFQLSDDEVRRYSHNPKQVKAWSVVKSKTGNLAANERAILNFDKGTVEKLATNLTKTNDAADWDGNAYPWLSPQHTLLYVPSGAAAANIKIAYRKFYL
jgi:hypothetical protein